VLLALAYPAALAERVQKDFVRALVEWSKLEPLLQVAEYFLSSSAGSQMLQQCRVAAAKATALGDDPAVELRTAVNLETIEKITGEEHAQAPQPFRREGLDALLCHPRDLDSIDEAICEIELDGVALGLDPSPPGLVEDAPDLAQAPPKLSARIVRHVPEQLAEMTARNGTRRKRQIGEEGAHFA
jgi:hypothetical protein